MTIEPWADPRRLRGCCLATYRAAGGMTDGRPCPYHEAPPRPDPTHRCKVCGALWRLNEWPFDWTLYSAKAGPCCDNIEMGEQIEPLTSFKRNCDPGPWGEPPPSSKAAAPSSPSLPIPGAPTETIRDLEQRLRASEERLREMTSARDGLRAEIGRMETVEDALRAEATASESERRRACEALRGLLDALDQHRRKIDVPTADGNMNPVWLTSDAGEMEIARAVSAARRALSGAGAGSEASRDEVGRLDRSGPSGDGLLGSAHTKNEEG